MVVPCWQKFAEELKKTAQVAAETVLLVKLLAFGFENGDAYRRNRADDSWLLIVLEAETTTCPPEGTESVFDDNLMENDESDIQSVCSPADLPNLDLTDNDNVPREALSTRIREHPVEGNNSTDLPDCNVIDWTDIVDNARLACESATETIKPLSPAPRCKTSPFDNNCESDVQNVDEAADNRKVSLEAALKHHKPKAEPRMLTERTLDPAGKMARGVLGIIPAPSVL